MSRLSISRRHVLGSAAALGALTAYGPARAAKPYDPPGALLEAAKKDGGLVLYTAAFPEVMQDQIATFNKRFPFVKVNMVRASGGQLITRVQSEAAAGKLEADVLDHSDRGQTKAIEHLFADYAPPNAADYMPSALVSPDTPAARTTALTPSRRSSACSRAGMASAAGRPSRVMASSMSRSAPSCIWSASRSNTPA